MSSAIAFLPLLAVLAAAALHAWRRGRDAARAYREAPPGDRAAQVLAGTRQLRTIRHVGAAASIAGLGVAFALMRKEALIAGLAVVVVYLPLLSLLLSLPIIRYRALVVGVTFDVALVLRVVRPRVVLTSLNLLAVAGLVLLCTVVGGHLQPRWVVIPFSALASVAVVLLISLSQPVLIRLLNGARPLRRPEAQVGLDRLAKQAGLSGLDMFVFRSPLRSANAWLTGLSVRRPRIFLTDALVEGLSSSELVAVVAHEVAHAKVRHVRQLLYRRVGSLLVSMSVFIVVVYLWVWLRPLSHPLTGYLLGACLSALLVRRLPNRRQQIKEMDADALAATWVGTEPLGSALQKLYQLNRDSDDDRAAQRLSSHPALRERLSHLAETAQRSRASPERGAAP